MNESIQDRLRSWAQNEEMVDQHYTAHGRDCNEAADRIEQLREVVGTAYRNINSLMCAYPDRFPQHAFEGTRDLLQEAFEAVPPSRSKE